ncbi:hypothetical protein ACNKHU_00085 [Shigella flexneri]
MEVKRLINKPTPAAWLTVWTKVLQWCCRGLSRGWWCFDISIIEIDEVDGEKTSKFWQPTVIPTWVVKASTAV